MKDNETEKSTSLGKKRVLAIILTACALILAAAIVFTVVMVSQDAAVSIEKPNGDDTDKDDEDGEDNDGEDNDDEDDTPSGGEMVFSLPVDGTISTSYTFWYNSTLNRYNLHEGIDFKAEAGTNVAAAYDGTVSSVTDTLLEGGCIVIDHGDGLQTVYASVDALSTLKAGDTVSRGEVIGTVSAAADVMGTEYNEGSHLHFEMRKDGKATDPSAYLDLDEK